jgi:hypothetical protein
MEIFIENLRVPERATAHRSQSRSGLDRVHLSANRRFRWGPTGASASRRPTARMRVKVTAPTGTEGGVIGGAAPGGRSEAYAGSRCRWQTGARRGDMSRVS